MSFLRYRIELESRLLAPATINCASAAVRRLAYEAADSGLLSPELAAGIQRVKGAKKLGRSAGRSSNSRLTPKFIWLTSRMTAAPTTRRTSRATFASLPDYAD